MTIGAIESTLGDSVDAALADGLTSINAVIAALQEQVDNIATGEDVDGINEAIEGVEQDLQDLLESNNVFTGNLTINSVPTLEFADNLGDRVNIVNGDVIIEASTDMDAALLQEVADRIVTITGDLKVRAQTSSAPSILFPNLVGASNLIIVQGGSFSFPALLSASSITLGDNYSSRLDGDINFMSATRVNGISTATVDASFSLSGEAANTISFSKASSINFAALPYYSPRTIIIVADDTTTLNFAALENKDANGNARDYTLNINGANELNIPGILDGALTLENVITVNLPEYVGEITVNGGVETLNMGALSENLSVSDNDLSSATITAADGEVEIDFTGASSLSDVNLAGELESLKLSGNTDLTNLIITAALKSLEINNTALGEISSDHTTGDLAKGGSLVITDNEDLVSFNAPLVDGLKKLVITGNDELESIAFASLENVPTDGSGVTVTIGGSAAPNALNAFDIVQESADEGSFNSGDSGMDGLKTFLTAANGVDASVLNVYFDSADTFTNSAGTTVNNQVIASHAANLLVVAKTATTGDSFAKRTWVYTTAGSDGTPHYIHANGATINFDFAATNASTVANILSTANVANFDTNGVTLTANANAAPKALLTTALARTGTVSAATATTTAGAETVSLKIGDYSAKLYLVASTVSGFTADPIDASNKGAENTLVTSASTTAEDILDALAVEFSVVSSPYTLTVSTTSTSGTLEIASKDISSGPHGTAVEFKQSNSGAGNLGDLHVNTIVSSDDTLIGDAVQFTLVSKVAGETLSEIGNPVNMTGVAATSSTAAAGTAGIFVAAGVPPISGVGTAWEVGAHSEVTTVAGVTYTEGITDSPGATNVGVNGVAGANSNRIGWL